jgi:YVTN family beta-propeller protein
MKLQSWLAAAALPVLFLAGCGSKEPAAPSYRVYVSNEGSGDLTVIDPVKMEALATVPLGKRARGIHPSPDGKLIYVALSGSPFAPPGVDESTLPPPDKSADGIGIFDIAQNKMLRKVPGGSDPEQFAVSKDGRLLYVSNEDAAGLSMVDPANGTVLKTLPTGPEPEGVTMSPDGRYIFVSSEDEGTIAVVDVAAQSVVKRIKVGRRPRGITFLPDSSKAYITNENDSNVSVIDVSKLEAAGQIAIPGEGQKPMGMAMTKDGSTLYVSTGRGKMVVAIATGSGQVTGSFEVGQRPWGIALSPDEKILFTANGPTGDVSVVDLATKTVTKKIKVGDRPWGIAVVAQ